MKIVLANLAILLASTAFQCQASDLDQESFQKFISSKQSVPASVLSVIGAENSSHLLSTLPVSVSDAQDDTSINRMIGGVNSATAEFARRKQGIQKIQDAHQDALLAIDIYGSITPVTAVAARIVGKILTDKVNIVIRSETARAEATFNDTVIRTVQAAVANASEGVRQHWLEKGVSDADAGQAMRDLIGPDQVDFFNKFGLAGLPEEAKTEIINAKTNMLSEALARYKSQSEQQRAADFQKLQTELNNQSAEITKVANDLASFQEKTAQQMDDLKTVFNARIDSLSAEISSVSNEVSAMQAHMWRGMNPHERLVALNDGFMQSMPSAEREKLKKSLSDTIEILDRRDTLLTGLQAVGQLGNLMARAGVPIDVENLQKNVDIGNSAVNVISNLALGNWMGALGSAGGLFATNGGGPDPQIMAKLDEMLALQKETLKKLDELSDQLEKSTNRILASIEKMDQKIDRIISAQKEDVYRNPLIACKEFSDRAHGYYKAVNGLYPSYMARASHYDADTGPNGYRYYVKCREFLDLVKSVDPSGSAPASPGVTPNIFVEEFVSSDNANLVGPHYRRMLAASMQSAATEPSKSCWNRSLAFLNDAPSRFSNAKIAEFACSSATDEDRKIAAENGETIDGRLALDRYLSVAAVRYIVSYAMFLAPFNSLQIERDGRSRLRSLDDLARVGVNPIPDPDAVVWPRHYVDLLNIAVAQQTVLSGIYALPVTERLLIDSDFGRKPELPRLNGDQMTDDARCKDDALKGFEANSWYKADSYPAITCLLAENPYFLSNLTRHIVILALLKSDSKLSNYTHALGSNDGTYIRAALPGLPLVWVQPSDDRVSPWMLDFRDAAGRPWRVALPTAAEIRTETVSYRVGGSDVVHLRNNLQQRVIMQSPEVTDLITSEIDGPLLQRAFLDDPSLSKVDLLQ